MLFSRRIEHRQVCGTAVTYQVPQDDNRERAVCMACEHIQYENPLNVVGTVPFAADGRVLGVRDDDALREGAVASLYYYALREAVRRGFSTVDFGGSHPVLSDGVLAYKRKWGVRLNPSPRWDYVAIRLAPRHPFTRAFLAEHPLIVETDGGLRALTPEPGPADGGKLAEWLSIGGLRGRIVPHGDAWAEAPLPSTLP